MALGEGSHTAGAKSVIYIADVPDPRRTYVCRTLAYSVFEAFGIENPPFLARLGRTAVSVQEGFGSGSSKEAHPGHLELPFSALATR